MAVDPAEILGEISPDAIPADAPPAVANYREADMHGVACYFCQKFTATNFDGDVPTGYCDQWEALAGGAMVCDRFASGPPSFGPGGEEMWDFADAEERTFNEIHLAGTAVVEDSGFVVKEVLRTGEWPVIPTKSGVVGKPLRVVRDGVSDSKTGVISLAELVKNFDAGAIASPQIPLSDTDDDHKNNTAVNTGFVRGLWIEDKDGGAVLKAKLEFTEPDVRDKVLRGTYADVSCGIPWRIKSRGQEFGATVEHVAITNRPFIDGLGPFLAAADQQEKADVVSYAQPREIEPAEKPDAPILSMQEILGLANGHLLAAFSHDYKAIDVKGEVVTVRNDVAESTWTVPFSVEPGSEDGQQLVVLSPSGEWTLEEGETIEPSAASGSPKAPLSELDKARRLRELRLSQPSTTKRDKEANVASISREELAALDLSDDARAAIQTVLDENARLSAQTREAEVDRRVDELKGLGFDERPGALKFYRQVYLSDDGGPAVVLSDSDGQEKARLTALEILDRFIDAIKGADSKVNLSDQALVSGNDVKPPEKSETETETPLDERVAAAKSDLYGKK